MSVPSPIDDFTVALQALADPRTSGDVLAQIAQRHPQLAASIAQHPNVYPDLLDWLATYGPAGSVAGASAAPATPASTPEPAPVSAPAVVPTSAYPGASYPGTSFGAAGYAAATPVAATTGPVTPPAGPPTAPSSSRRLALWVAGGALVGALVVGGVAFAVMRGGDEPVAAPAPTTAAASPTAVDAGATTPVTPSPTPAATTAAPAPTLEPTPTPTPTPEPTPTPTPTPTTPERSANDELYCGLTGTVVAVGYTDRFEAIVCAEEGGLVYIGTNLDSGSNIRLPAWAEGNGYAANNGSTVYSLNPMRLKVTDSSGVILDETVYSWQAW